MRRIENDMKKRICLFLAVCMLLTLAACGKTTAGEEPAPQNTEQPAAATEKPTQETARPSGTEDTAPDAPDYGAPENWAYFELGEDRQVDVFLICPTVDTRSETNSFDLNDKLKGKFIYALDLERGIFDETGRLFSPYYRQMSINAYTLPEIERVKAREIAYADVSAAFRWYLDNENDGRGIILAGFSQGGELCLELLKEYYGGDSAEAQALRERLIAVYSIGWMVTEEMTSSWPQIVPAAGETDTGTVICFDCEDGNVSETIIIPAGMKALSINPLNWKTDSTPADKSLNRGAVFAAGGEAIPALCGAYIGEKGELIVTDVTAADYPPGLDIFPEGAYHLYDYMFFFTNLKENVAARTAAWAAAQGRSGAADVALSDDASDFVLLSDAVPDAILEIRYYSTYNFVGERIDGYEEPLAFLTREAAEALREVSDELVSMGYRLKIFDAYRPQMAVMHFMNWALDTEDTRMKEYFYPELEKDVLFPQGYIAEHSGHSRGSTVDLTLFDMVTEREVDMGGTFDYFGELSHPDYTGITEEQYANRMLLREVMMRHGFRPLEEEWWHFTLENEPYPDTYFTFPINSDSLNTAEAQTKRALEEIRSRGVLRVGTAGDYQPMSYLDPASGQYVGFDAELAEDLAAALGVELEYVPSSWPTLMADTLAGNFDLAICGITITEARQEQALMSIGYLGNGKTVLCRAEDADKYTSLEAINRPEVRLMENPGGLNEKFAREKLPQATLIIHDVNQEIPGLIAAGEADVMITEIMEAGFYAGQDDRLAAPLIHEPFTHGELGVLMPKGSEDLLAYVNAFLEKKLASGRIDELAEEYIYRCTETEEQLPSAA